MTNLTKAWLRVGAVLVIWFVSSLFCFSSASEWKNPMKFSGDPNIVRLSRGNKELSELEKQEIKKYGFTGLELMIYAFFNENMGYQCREAGVNFYNLTSGGKVFRTTILDKNLYLFSKLDMLNTEKSPTGEVWRR